MNTMAEKYQAFIESCEQAGKPLIDYACPGCGSTITSLVPADQADRFDTMTACPHCNDLHFRVVDHDRRVYLARGNEPVPQEVESWKH